MAKVKEDATAASVVPANAMGSSSSQAGTGGIDTFDPLLQKKKNLRNIVKRKSLLDVKNGR